LTLADRRRRNVGNGASLDVKDKGRGEIPESGFKDRVSVLGVANDFGCKVEKDLLVFDLSAGDVGIVHNVGEERIGDYQEGEFSGMPGAMLNLETLSTKAASHQVH
jgi:hypothetical protein